MTAYWDTLRRQVRDASATLSNQELVAAVVDIETTVLKAVTLMTGDREFPHDLREKVLDVIAANAIDFGHYISDRMRRVGSSSLPVNDRARDWLLTMRYSILLEELHAVFHLVAGRKIKNRYNGMFTDDPTEFLRARQAAWEQHA